MASNKAERFEGVEPDFVAKYELYDESTNANKFWHIRRYGSVVVRHYGRHGTKGCHVVTETSNRWAASDVIQCAVWAKVKKGYVLDTTTILDHLARRLG